MQESPDSTSGVAIYTVAVRLPPSWPGRPGLWFGQAEAQFELASITNERKKFDHIISQLDCRHAAEVEDVITSPPEHEPYKTEDSSSGGCQHHAINACVKSSCTKRCATANCHSCVAEFSGHQSPLLCFMESSQLKKLGVGDKGSEDTTVDAQTLLDAFPNMSLMSACSIDEAFLW
ncbi:hypothetical protein Cfor_03245 [Coptotermes formosanus]|uniref:DUF7041 domain-containing protein n=1 Tax=Coptotermes formosanus TaxID=36987 RepID=A0A6L2PXN3_COPFO|nr:hypothetical protein Cfor_03245 [Coptotermes formosanus]